MEENEYKVMFEVENTHWWFVTRRCFIEAFLGTPRKKRLRIADVGAGTGGTTKWLSKYGTVAGVEPSAVGRRLARKRGVSLQKGTALRTGLRAGSFDLVTILDVLYHKNISDDVAALKEAYRILRPGGTLLVTDCAFAWLAGRHHRFVHGKRRYTRSKLTGKIQQAGFRITRASYTFFLTFPLIAASRLLERMVSSNTATSSVSMVPFIANLLLRTVGNVEARLLRSLSFPLGSSVIVAATKPYGS